MIFENLESFIFIKKKFNEWIKMRSQKNKENIFWTLNNFVYN